VLADGALVGAAYRGDCANGCAVDAPAAGRVDLLVENCGRVNFGGPSDFLDRKGLLGTPPPLPGAVEVRCLPLDDVSRVRFEDADGSAPAGAPAFFRGSFAVDAVADTYLDTRGLSRGLLWVNGALLGRYWETAGPQHALYAPAPALRAGRNEVVLLDLEGRSPGRVRSTGGPRWTPA